MIEALFEWNKDLKKLDTLQDYVQQDEECLIIQRTYFPEGRNRIKVNGLTVTGAQLKNIGKYLMDFHGPHDHQMLLSSDSHLGMLDRLIHFKDELKGYQKEFGQYDQLKRKYEELQNMNQSRERDLDLLSHQVKELEQRVSEMARQWEAWAVEAHVKPWRWRN